MKKIVLSGTVALIVLSLFFLGIGCKESAQEEVVEEVEEAAEEVEEAAEEVKEIDEKDLPVLNLGFSVNIGSVVSQYIIENGLDKENGFILDLVIFPTGVAINEGIASNDIDLAATGSGGLFAIQNLGVEWIADWQLQATGIGIFVRGDSPIATVQGVNSEYPDVYGNPETVKGSTVLATFGTIGEFQALKWLDIIGVEPSEVEMSHMQFPDAFTAMQAEKADAANLIPTNSFAAADMGWVEVGSMKSLDIEFFDGLILNPNTVNDDNPGKRQALIEYLRLIYDLAPLFNGPDGIKAEWGAKFFESQGQEIKSEWLDILATTWPFYTKQDYVSGDHDLGAWLLPLIDFYIANESLPADFKDTFNESLNDEYIREALDF
jgi:sulfonate transport system substrate-binding protein